MGHGSGMADGFQVEVRGRTRKEGREQIKGEVKRLTLSTDVLNGF